MVQIWSKPAIKAMLYTMVDGILYKHGRNGILLKGIT
jgi:hypothetical protein